MVVYDPEIERKVSSMHLVKLVFTRNSEKGLLNLILLQVIWRTNSILIKIVIEILPPLKNTELSAIIYKI